MYMREEGSDDHLRIQMNEYGLKAGKLQTTYIDQLYVKSSKKVNTSQFYNSERHMSTSLYVAVIQTYITNVHNKTGHELSDH